MPVVQAKKLHEISRATDKKSAIMEKIGDLSGIDVMFNHVLVGTNIRSEKTEGGIFLPESAVREDEFQGKCGLVLKKGPTAFLDDQQNDFHGQTVDVGEWVVYRVGDGWALTVNGVACRMVQDVQIRMKVTKPELIF